MESATPDQISAAVLHDNPGANHHQQRVDVAPRNRLSAKPTMAFRAVLSTIVCGSARKKFQHITSA